MVNGETCGYSRVVPKLNLIFGRVHNKFLILVREMQHNNIYKVEIQMINGQYLCAYKSFVRRYAATQLLHILLETFRLIG